MTKTEKKETEKTADKSEKPEEREIGGFKDQNMPEPTRYGDWEVNGRCSDF